jgi:hypothetical protein
MVSGLGQLVAARYLKQIVQVLIVPMGRQITVFAAQMAFMLERKRVRAG